MYHLIDLRGVWPNPDEIDAAPHLFTVPGLMAARGEVVQARDELGESDAAFIPAALFRGVADGLIDVLLDKALEEGRA
jgi:hypothetical protein